MTSPDVAQIVRGLTGSERDITVSLCGNAWTGVQPTPGILVMNGLGFMHIDAIKSADGSWRRFKARPLPLGQQVRAAITGEGM